MTTHIMLGSTRVLGAGIDGVTTVEVTLPHERTSWAPGRYRTIFEAILAPRFPLSRGIIVEGLLIRESDADLEYTRFLYRSGLWRQPRGMAHLRSLRERVIWELETMVERRVFLPPSILEAAFEE